MNNPTFMHYRKFDRMGQIAAKGGLTLAIAQDGNQLTVALAQCGRKDNFRKDLGRAVASGRLAAGKGQYVFNLTLPAETSVKSYVNDQSFVKERVHKLLAGGR